MNLLLYVVSIYVVKSKRRILFATFFIYATMIAGSLLMLSSHKLFSEVRSGVVWVLSLLSCKTSGFLVIILLRIIAIGFAH